MSANNTATTAAPIVASAQALALSKAGALVSPSSGVDGAGGGFDGALADNDLTTCERTQEGWILGGTLVNPTEGTVDYRVYASRLAADGDTRALVQVNVDDVDATASKEWTSDIAVDEDDLECILRVERYAA